MEAYPQVTYSFVFPGAIDREHEGSCKAGHMIQCIFSSLFPSIDDSFTSQLSMCPAQLPLSFQINPLQLLPSFQIQSNKLFWFEFQSHQFWLWNPIVCLNYLPFGCDMHILILFTYQNFQSNPYFTLQSLSFTFKEVCYFFLRNCFTICFPNWSSFVCFWWSAILCFWGRVCLHSPEYPETLYVNHTCCKLREILLPLPSMYWNSSCVLSYLPQTWILFILGAAGFSFLFLYDALVLLIIPLLFSHCKLPMNLWTNDHVFSCWQGSACFLIFMQLSVLIREFIFFFFYHYNLKLHSLFLLFCYWLLKFVIHDC